MLSLVQFCYGYAGPNLPRMEDWGLLKLRLVTSPVENYLPLATHHYQIANDFHESCAYHRTPPDKFVIIE